MNIELKKQFTLLIPTYNRHDCLQKLLRYLNHQHVEFSVFVLDSSDPEMIRKNSSLISSLSIKIDHIVYPSNTRPFDKFSDGFTHISTPFSALCADDDIIILSAINDCLNFLLKNPDYSLAHGFYFDFTEHENEMFVDRLIYFQPSLTDNSPEKRICRLMQNYEATTYAIHRTEIATEAFKKAASLKSILSSELSSSVLCVSKGKAARLPKFYSGRNNQRLTTYSSHHPIEYINTSPEALFNEYYQYRKLILDALEETFEMSPETCNNLDIAHLCYLSPYLRPKILNFILNYRLTNNQASSCSDLWKYWTELNSFSLSNYFKLLYKLKSKIIPSFSFTYFIQKAFGAITGDLNQTALLPNQAHRHYCFTKSFLKQANTQNMNKVRLDIHEIIEALTHYY
jgi:glycosyltransferase domain-containing protein